MDNVEKELLTKNIQKKETEHLTENAKDVKTAYVIENPRNLENRLANNLADEDDSTTSPRKLKPARNLLNNGMGKNRTEELKIDIKVLQKLQVPDASKFYDPTDMDLSMKLLEDHIYSLRIADVNEKFNYLCSILPSNACDVVSDYILNPPKFFKCEILVLVLCERTFLIEVRKPDRRLTEEEIDDHTPSAILRRMRAQIMNQDEDIFSYYREFLPQSMHEIVRKLSKTTSLDVIATFGDSIYYMELGQPQRIQPPSKTSKNVVKMTTIKLKGEIENLGQMVVRKLSDLESAHRKELQVVACKQSDPEFSDFSSEFNERYEKSQVKKRQDVSEQHSQSKKAQVKETKPNQKESINQKESKIVQEKHDKSVQSSPSEQKTTKPEQKSD